VTELALAPLVARAQEAYEAAVRHPSGQSGLAQLVEESRAAHDAEALVIALRAQAWVARCAMRAEEARRLLDLAARVAARNQLRGRLVEVLATRAAVNLELGRGGAARRDLDRANTLSAGRPPADLTMQRAVLDHNEGRLPEAADLYGQLLRDAGTPPAIHVKAANNLALIESGRGRYSNALARLAQVEDEAASLGPALVAIVADTRAWITVQSGRLTDGLRLLDVAADRHREAGLSLGEHYLEHSDALEALRLLPEAMAMAAHARDEFSRHGVPLLTAEAQARLARLAEMAGDQAGAESAARAAGELFRRQRRTAWADHVLCLEVLARVRQGTATAGDARAARRAARRLEAAGLLSWAADAYLVAARCAAAVGASAAEVADLTDAERLCRGGPALLRLKGHLAGARRAVRSGRRRELLGHARAGLVDLAEHRAALPSTELRALASGHGVELGRLALRELLRHGSATDVLLAMERTRAVSLLTGEDAPVADGDPLLLELRSVHEELAAHRAAGDEPAELVAHQRALERRIRRESWRSGGAGAGLAQPPGVDELRSELRGRTLVEYATLDEELVAVVVGPARTRLVRLGPMAPVDEEGAFVLFALRRLATGTATPAAATALWAGVAGAVDRLRARLVTPLRLTAGSPVVVVPASRTWRLPWAHLCGVPASVAPSSASWLRASRREEPLDGAVVLVAGPDLPGASEEVAALGDLHTVARVLAPPVSTVDAVVEVLRGARLAHLACHGRLRADNPTFSSFLLSAGELTVHELSLRGVAPYRVVLSACDSGADATYDGDEFVGFVSALLGQGTAGLLASCVQVSDVEAVPLMIELHRRVLGGATLGEAVHAAAVGCESDRPEALAVRAGFTAYGAG
jgi:tetratricopeptide (TPR) repeat protein